MRKIKFRGIYVDTNEFVYGYLCNIKDDKALIFDPTGIGTYYVVKPETVGQYTGLKDSTEWEELTEDERAKWVQISGNFPSKWKGKEIYEGDLLKPIKGYDDIYKIEYYLSAFHWFEIYDGHFKKYIEESSQKHATIRVGSNYKIIGNIPENPELSK